ncbi:MAG: flagellar hook protein FlgE [Rhodospirillales bacterium]|nr:flagellar hook protein FlgE [Rhodospirillales bacterium]
MSLSGAMNTAVTGINAQSKALGNISDNVANVQTTGYKRVETSFASLLTQATPRDHEPGGVLSRPLYMNNVQGTIQSTGTITNLAIAGEGMFAVSQKTGVSTSGGTPTFATDPLYTRAGDFSLDDQGYLVNGSGYYLNGWTVDTTTGIVSKNATLPIQVTQLKDNPQQTTSISLSANLPTQPDSNLDVNSANAVIDMPPQAVTVYDPQGTGHVIELGWSWDSATPDTWSLALASSDAAITTVAPTTTNDPVPLQFYTSNNAGTGAQAGSIDNIDGAATGTVGSDANISFLITYANGDTQSITLDFGAYGVAQQLTNFTGTDIDFNSATQDGLPPGSFRNLSISDDGMVTLNYDNGNQKTVYQVPIAQFQNYEGLQSEPGNAFSASSESGTPALLSAGANGTGNIQSSSVEGSNVDVSSELVKMIQAQSAYAANARVISTANEMLQTIEQVAR